MKTNNKKIIISSFVFFIILLLIISIIIFNNLTKKPDLEIDEEKIYCEIEYFDLQFFYMINLLNNVEQSNDFYINWSELENNTQILTNYWNSVILDFNYLDIDKNHITSFGKNLDTLYISVKNKDKDNMLNNIITLYKGLISYSETLNNYYNNTILNIKYNLLNAYSIIEKNNWTLTYEYIVKASENMSNLVNSIENNKYNQYNINQAYIAIKELENIINVKDIDLFYLKYKIVNQKLKQL